MVGGLEVFAGCKLAHETKEIAEQEAEKRVRGSWRPRTTQLPA